MSFTVAVWDGPRPATDVEAQREFARRWDAADARALAGRARLPATPALRAFTADVRRYVPDGDRDVDGVWADGRVAEGVDGDFLHTALTREGLGRALDVLAGLAGRHGLVCFDPQTGAVLDRPAPGPPVRRPPRPGVGTLRRLLQAELAPVGFGPVDGGLQLLWRDDVRVALTPSAETEQGERVAGASIAVYRESDWQDHLRWFAREAGTPYDPAAKFVGGYGNVLDFGLLVDPGELLDRPHQHAWVVPDQAAAAAAARQIGELLVQRVLPALAELAALLPNRRLGLRHRPALGVREKAWLRHDEVCPWAPCGEPFRTVDAGGLWPPRGR